jgi:hypothetical protein
MFRGLSTGGRRLRTMGPSLRGGSEMDRRRDSGVLPLVRMYPARLGLLQSRRRKPQPEVRWRLSAGAIFEPLIPQ